MSEGKKISGAGMFSSVGVVAKFKVKLQKLRGKNVQPEKPEKTLAIWSKHTTFHVILDWYVSKHWVSFIFWLALFIIFLAIAIYQIVFLFQDFTAYPHYTTNIYVEESEFPDFPNVTLCSLNRVNKEKAKALNLSIEAISYLFWAQMVVYDVSFDGKPAVEANARKHWQDFQDRTDVADSLKNPYGLLKHLGHNCNDTMVVCLFGGKKFTCCNQVTEVVSAEYGLCLTFTAPKEEDGKPRKQKIPGISGGIKLFYNNRIDLYHGQENLLNNYLEQGMAIIPNYNPYQMSYLNPIILSPGTHARITLKTMVRKYVKPKLQLYKIECVDNGKLDILAGPYDRANCIRDCIQKFVHDKCGCIFVSEHQPGNRICHGNDVTDCLGSVSKVYNLRNATEQKILSDCMDTCKNPCEPTPYASAVTNTAVFPSPHYLYYIYDILRMGWPGVSIANAQAAMAIDLFYSERGYLMVEKHEKANIFAVIGNIGGQISLWLGASIITIIQTIYYVFVAIARAVRKPGERKKSAAQAKKAKQNSNVDPDPEPDYMLPPGMVHRASVAGPPPKQEILYGRSQYDSPQKPNWPSWNRSRF